MKKIFNPSPSGENMSADYGDGTLLNQYINECLQWEWHTFGQILYVAQRYLIGLRKSWVMLESDSFWKVQDCRKKERWLKSTCDLLIQKIKRSDMKKSSRLIKSTNIHENQFFLVISFKISDWLFSNCGKLTAHSFPYNLWAIRS